MPKVINTQDKKWMQIKVAEGRGQKERGMSWG